MIDLKLIFNALIIILVIGGLAFLFLGIASLFGSEQRPDFVLGGAVALAIGLILARVK